MLKSVQSAGISPLKGGAPVRAAAVIAGTPDPEFPLAWVPFVGNYQFVPK